MAISKEQIFAVADELDAAGQNPTLANVCRRRSKSEPPCRPNIEPGVGAGLQRAGGG